jgi:competence protein ComEC
MIGFSISFALGTWLLQQQAVLPELHWGTAIIFLFFAYLLPTTNQWQIVLRSLLFSLLALSSGFFYAAAIAHQRLSDELPAAWQGRDIIIVGVVAELPRQHERGLGFVFDVEQILTSDAHVPKRILLSTYNNAKYPVLMMHAGERWQLTVRLKRPHSTSNPHNFDFEAWALERNLRATGYVHQKGDNRRIDISVESPGYLVEIFRESVRNNFQQTLRDAPYVGVLNALAIGEQSSIPAAQWQIFTRTGVNHLMSISGLHITMLAGLVFTIFYWLWCQSSHLLLWLPARKAAAVAGLFVAISYAFMSGYGVPAQRTVYMLAAVAATLWASRNIAPSQLLSSALMVVLLLDPWAVISPGFWLSFGAVALIFYITANRFLTRNWLVEYGRIQWAMSLGLIPLLLAMFQQVSVVSPIANAFAIPLISFIVVPLTLMGAILQFDWPLQLAHYAMSNTMLALEWLNNLPTAVWTQHAPPSWSIVIGMLGVFWILLPRGFPSRYLGFILLLPMFLIEPAILPYGNLRLSIFDVGQGLAVAAQTSNHALLYDTGPLFNTEANSGNRILIPALKGMGITQLDKLILTHNDSDHTGGALSIMQAMPINVVSSTLPEDSPILLKSIIRERCSEGQKWEWDGVYFEMLHPTVDIILDEKIRDNDKGCVLRISTGENSVLLTADIEKSSERRLLEHYPDKLNSTIMVVPHHGSKTSSTPEFVNTVAARYAIFTSGYRNQFGHPKPEIIERYRTLGSALLRTDQDGALLVEMDNDSINIERYRATHARYWHDLRSEFQE